jgi:hypothetical protein
MDMNEGWAKSIFRLMKRLCGKIRFAFFSTSRQKIFTKALEIISVRLRLILLAFSVLAYPLLASTPAHADVHSHLQWFDSRGEIMDLDWATNVQWIWALDKTPLAQVIITVPEQLHLTIADETQAKFLNGIPDSEGKSTNRTLVVEMDGPRKTIQLKKIDEDATEKEIGLTIILMSSTPNIIPSDSCDRLGVSIESKEETGNFLFLAASCKMLKAAMRISLETSHDATIANDLEELSDHHYIENPLVILIPRKNLKKDSVLASVRVNSETEPTIVSHFELVYTNESEVETDVENARPPKPLATPEKKSTETKRWFSEAELNLGYLGYLQDGKNNSGLNPNEFNLGGKISTERRIGSTHSPNGGFAVKADLEAPLLTVMPNAHFPASGQYTADTRASFTVLDRGKILFRLEPGLEVFEEHLQDRSDVNGIYAGPMLAANLSGVIAGLGNRALSLLAEASPLAGQQATPFFQSWDWSVELALEMARIDFETHWELVLRFHDLTLHAPSLPDAKSTETTLGIRMGF